MKVRTRIAPSPTGPLHIGTARTALFNFLYAAQNKGAFILRIEDTDLERSNPIFERDIEESLRWLGLDWGEFYRQSERLDLYEKHLKKLLKDGRIFWCPHSSEDLAEERREQISRKIPLRHFCSARDSSSVGENSKGILRFRNDRKGPIVFNDLLRGKISFAAELLGDFSVAKDLRTPLYNLAVVADDSDLKISHVIRGEDHISNTPKQILLFEALGFAIPEYAHVPLILGTDRSKLSKRHGALSVLEYKKTGYLAEAVLNFMVLLGWHPAPLAMNKHPHPKERDEPLEEKELFTMPELIKEFSLQRIQKGGAVFDADKLKWLNREHMKIIDTGNLAERLKFFVMSDMAGQIDKNPEKWLKITDLLRERLTTMDEVGDMAEYFYKDVYYPRELLRWKENQDPGDIVRHLVHLRSLLSEAPEWGRGELEALLMPYAAREGRGAVLWPFRAALSGRRVSAGPFEIAEILGKDETIRRVEKAVKMFE